MNELFYDKENKKFYVRELITESYGDILIATDEKYVDVTDEIVTLRSQPKQERQIKKGDKVSIHCRKDREEYIIAIYDGKVGEVTDIWDKKYPWGHIAVKLDNGCNNSFHEDELEVLDESYCKTRKEVKSENNVDINHFEKEKGQYECAPSQTFTGKEIEKFIHDHIQQKIDNDELHLTGIGNDNFEREFMIYRNALFEGIVNGISMCNNKVEGIEDK